MTGNIKKILMKLTIEEINEYNKNSLVNLLGIRFTNCTANYIEAEMPVCSKTSQPFGYLHGGASLALAETVAGVGSYLNIDTNKFNAFGMQVSGNHISSVNTGIVIAKAKLLHKGTSTHVWDVKIEDNNGKLISTSRITNAVVRKKKEE